MTYRHGLTFALVLLTAPPVLAQSSDAPTAQRYEVGVGISPFFLPFLDESGNLPPSGWVTVPAGRFQLQLDYLRNVRGQPLYYAGYYDTDEQGRDFSYDRARVDHHVDQVFGAAVLWPFPRGSTTTYLLLGGAYQHTADRWCVARGEPEPDGRLDFPAGFDCSRDPVDVNLRYLVPLYGVGFDSSLESRFFLRVQYRARLHPMLGDLRVGVGVRF